MEKKLAALDIVNVSIKIYFKLNTLRLCKNLIRTVRRGVGRRAYFIYFVLFYFSFYLEKPKKHLCHRRVRQGVGSGLYFFIYFYYFSFKKTFATE